MTNLDKSFYRKCEECNRLRLLGTQCKQMTGDTCDNDSRYFYNESEVTELLKQSSPDDFDSTIKELGFEKVENEKLSNRLMIEHKEYLLEYEGYAYVLYKIIKKEIPSAKLMLKEPIAHFQDANKLKAFVDILKDQF